MKVQDPAVYGIRKDMILQHARHLFATKGYAETTMDDIAHACKMQKASLYHYFESKTRLLQDLIAIGADNYFGRLLDCEKGATFEESLRILATTMLKEMDEPAGREFFKIIHFESYKNPFIFKAWRENPMQSRKGIYAVFEKHLAGKVESSKIAMVLVQFVGALVHYVSTAKLRDQNYCLATFDDASYIDQLVLIFCRGIEGSCN